jgi:hypothetical protein
MHGHLEVLKWAHENGCPWDERTCSWAARGGHLEVLKWARENGCPWDERTCECAAAQRHFDVLVWAHENGCPWEAREEWIAYQHDVVLLDSRKIPKWVLERIQ